MSFLDSVADKIPKGIRKLIIDKKMIDTAMNLQEKSHDPKNPYPMEFLFDVYAEFLDPSGEYQNWDCPTCRQHVLDNFRKLKDYL